MFLSNGNSISYVFQRIVVFILLAVLAGCDRGSDSAEAGAKHLPKGMVLITGQAQKGMFTDLTIKVFPLFAENIEPINAEILPGGKYEAIVPEDTPLKLEANGSFIDELSGKEVVLAEPLELVIIDSAEAPASANINLLTHLVAKQTLARVAGGAQLADAFAQSQDFVRQTLGLPVNTQVVELDLLNIERDSDLDDPNMQLLLFSAAVLNEWPAGEGQEFGETFFNSFVTDFASLESGTDAISQLSPFVGLNAEALYSQLQDAEVLTNLPVLQEPLRNETWQCSLTNGCGWVSNESPVVSLSSGIVFESNGRADIRIRLSEAPQDDLQINIRTISDSAQEFTDFVPLSTDIVIPAGRTEVIVPVTVLIDDEDESAEVFKVVIIGDVTGYQVTDRETTLKIVDGYQQQNLLAVNYVDAISLGTHCLHQVGVPSQLARPGCAVVSAFSPYHTGVAASADVSLSLSANCSGDIGCQAAVYANDWLLRISLASRDGQTTSLLGVYQYPVAALRSSSERRLQLAMNADANAIVSAAQVKDESVQLKVELLLDQSKVRSEEVDSLVAVPPILEAQGMEASLAASGWNLEAGPSTCQTGEYGLSGSFSAGGLVVHPADVCVSFSVDETMVLESGEIDLSGDELPLPEFHGLFIQFNNGRLVPKGGKRLLVPVSAQELPVLSIPISTLEGKDSLYKGLLADQTTTDDSDTEVALFIHRDGFPYAFQIDSAQMTPEGVRINFDDVRYLHLGFSANDPRNGELPPTNDAWLAGLQRSGSLFLTSSGLEGDLQASSGVSLPIAYPESKIILNNQVNLRLENGLQAQSHRSSGIVGLKQSAACKGNLCAANEGQEFLAVGEIKFDQNGSQLASLAAYPTSQDYDVPAWGKISDGPFAFSLPEQMALQQTVHFAAPGYLIDAEHTGPISRQLLAHIQDNPASERHTVHPVDSEQAILGNYWPVGLSAGPELYVDSTGEVNTGSGTDMAGQSLVINSPNENGTDEHTLTLRSGKYVLRPSGVTGVMNVADSAIQAPLNFSGFDIQFERFALRFRDNQVDDYSFIDGGFNLPGDADLDLAFESLGFYCDGSLAAANLVASDCEANPNAENCGHRLLSWKSSIDIYNIAFESQVNASCGVGDQQLGLQHLLTMNALNKPLDAESLWSSEGELQSSRLMVSSDYRLEMPGNDKRNGFAIRPYQGSLELTEVNGQPYGTVNMDLGILSLKFWDALQADLRIANISLTTAEPSVLVPRGRLSALNLDQSNQSLQAYVTQTPNLDFTVAYEWGESGFGLDLPAYFTPRNFGNDDIGKPRFVGRYQESDLIVMTAGAGVNWIEPQHTQVSFGVGANIDTVAANPFRFSLSGAEGLARIDDFLVSSGLINAPVFEPTFGPLETLYAGLAEFSGAGIEKLIKDSLIELGEQSLNATGQQNLFSNYADGLSAVANFGSDLTLRVNNVLGSPLLDISGSFENVRARLLTLEQSLEQDLTASELVQTLSLLSGIRQSLNGYVDSVRTIQTDLEQSLFLDLRNIADFRVLLQDMSAFNTNIKEHFSGLTQIDASLCEVDVDYAQASISPDTGAYLTPLFEQFVRMEEISTRMQQGSALMDSVETLAQGDVQILRNFDTVAAQVSLQANELGTLVAAVTNDVAQQACAEQGNSTNNLVQALNSYLDVQQVHVDQMLSLLTFDNGWEPSTDPEQQPRADLGLDVAFEPTVALLMGAIQLFDQRLEEAESTLRLHAQSVDQSGVAMNSAEGIDILQTLSQSLRTGGTPDIAGFSANYSEVSGRDIQEFIPYLAREAEARLLEALSRPQLAALSIDVPGAGLSGQQLQNLMLNQLLASPAIADLRDVISQQMEDVHVGLTTINQQVSDAINRAIAKALAPVNGAVDELFASANSTLKSLPVRSARMDGLAEIAGNDLRRVHIDASWTLAGSGGGEPTGFVASFDALAGTDDYSGSGCLGASGTSPLQLSIETNAAPISLLGADMGVEQLRLEFTSNKSSDAIEPVNLAGALFTRGDIGFSGFGLRDLGLTAAIGQSQNYLGARGAAIFGNKEMEAAFFAGASCSAEPLLNLDDDARRYVDVPDNGFVGIYARGAVPIPLVDSGCGLRLTANAKMGAWLLDLRPGGLFGGGLTGTVACLGSVRGSVETALQQSTRDNFRYDGSGFAVAGFGDCEPGRWTSVSRSRRDKWCTTGDVRFDAFYEDGVVDVYNIKASATH